jgi:hypothetical protein
MSQKMKKTPRISCTGRILSIILGGLLVLAASDCLAESKQEVTQQSKADHQTFFDTPDQAVNALLEALKNDDDKAMLKIFGPEFEDVIALRDRVETQANRMRVYRAAEEMWILRDEGNNKKIFVVGKEVWPMPIPLVEEGKGWRFNTAEGIEEIIHRRIGRNELSAIEVCRYYLTAQKYFATRDRDGDKVLEYAQAIKSTDGNHDGLYWETADQEEISPFGPLVAEVKEHLEGGEPGDPFKGYYFKILTRQGKNVPGGQYDYLINGNMIAGFAMIGFPADYGRSGVMTFLTSHHGQTYQKDLGPDTATIASAISEFNLDKTWAKVSDGSR